MYVCGIVHCHDPNDASWINYTKNQTENDISNDEKYTSFFSWNSFIRFSVQITWRRRLHHNLVSHLRWHWLMGIITEYAWFGTSIEVKIFNIHLNFLFDSDSLIYSTTSSRIYDLLISQKIIFSYFCRNFEFGPFEANFILSQCVTSFHIQIWGKRLTRKNNNFTERRQCLWVKKQLCSLNYC